MDKMNEMSVEEFMLKTKKLKLLLDNKMITQEQFDNIKQKLLDDMRMKMK